MTAPADPPSMTVGSIVQLTVDKPAIPQGSPVDKSTKLQGRVPDDDMVICPGCVHQFRAVPVNVQARIADLERERDALAAQVLAMATELLDLRGSFPAQKYEHLYAAIDAAKEKP
jgi:hypothetical protein